MIRWLVVAGRQVLRAAVFTLGILRWRLLVFVVGPQVSVREPGFTTFEQPFEHGGSVGDFLGGNNTIMVGIERIEEDVRWRTVTMAAGRGLVSGGLGE